MSGVNFSDSGIVNLLSVRLRRHQLLVAQDYRPCKVHVLAPHKQGVTLIYSWAYLGSKSDSICEQ